MNMKILSFIIFLSMTGQAHAENHLIVFGGGGEPVGDETIFDHGMEKLGKNLDKANWKYQVSFNGGHKDTEKILQKNYSSPSAPTTQFTQENYTGLIEDYKNKILKGEINSGDQLMIIVNTHGATKSAGQLTHKIAATGNTANDLNLLTGAKLVSLDSLQELVRMTNERGIKLGIVDLSCHSGNTQALKENAPHTCIISSTGPAHYGYAGPQAFTDQFLSALKPGTTLEEAFLKARLESKDPAYPMISTSENDKIIKDVYAAITPFLYYYNPVADKMTKYVLDNSNQEQMCKRDQYFDKLMAKIDDLKSVVKSKRNSFNADKLKDLLQNYKDSQDIILKASMAIDRPDLNTVETFDLPANSGYILSNFKISYTWKELVALDVDKRIADFERFKNFSESKKSKDDNQSVVDFLKKVKQKKQQIMAHIPLMKNFDKEAARLVKQMDKSQEMVSKIALQEKMFYEELYRRSQTNDPNDPCKKIVF